LGWTRALSAGWERFPSYVEEVSQDVPVVTRKCD
jgi:hypothetical protein